MGSLSIWHWIIVLIVLALGIPLVKMLFRAGSSSDEKTCPQCAEKIKAAALVCRFCGYEFPKS